MTSHTPKKHLGQNFLTDQSVIDDLVTAAEINNETLVVEIGPGKGAVTASLLKQATNLIAVELDDDLIPLLNERFGNNEGFTLKHQDILDEPFSAISTEPFTLVSALPFQITSPLLHKIVIEHCTGKVIITRVALLIQKEVAKKVVAAPPNASYFSNLMQVYGTAALIREVPREVFDPVPNVDGAIITLVPHEHALIPSEDVQRFQKFLRNGFSSPRKMLNKVFDPKVLGEAGIDPSLRAEALVFGEWVELFERTK